MKPEQSLVERLRSALDETQGLLVAMLHETRPAAEIEAQIIDNREALNAAAQLERQLAAPAELPPLPHYYAMSREAAPRELWDEDDMQEYARAAQRAELPPLTDEQIIDDIKRVMGWREFEGYLMQLGQSPVSGSFEAVLSKSDAIELCRAIAAQRAAPTAQGSGKDALTPGDFWLKHDDDLRYVKRVLEAGHEATDADRRKALDAIHALRTIVRAAPQEAPQRKGG